MSNTTTKWRNAVSSSLYRHILKPIFFLRDPENVHDRMINIGAGLGRHSITRKTISALFEYSNPILEQNILGINFKNPIGLAAGFDKNAELTDVLPSVGFGFEEVGSITGNASPGNEGPRLWRLKKSKGLLVYYGLKNDGCEVIANRLKDKHFDIPIGTSVAMTNCKDNLVPRNAVADFAKAFKTMESIGSYITVNISCPNVEGGQPFSAAHKLDYLFDILDTIPTKKPIFIKLSPDLEKSQVDALLDTAKKHRIHGIICSNLTKNRENSKIKDKNVPTVGGMSGKIVQDKADDLLAYIYKREGKKFVLVGCGGVFSAEDAYKKIRLGASLIQMITGMIYEGPQVISEINRGLVELLKKDGFTHISQAVGADNQ